MSDNNCNKKLTKEQWEQKFPGPYVSQYIRVSNYSYPFNHLDYVYFDGCYLESFPLQIRIKFPKDKEGEFSCHLKKYYNEYELCQKVIKMTLSS